MSENNDGGLADRGSGGVASPGGGNTAGGGIGSGGGTGGSNYGSAYGVSLGTAGRPYGITGFNTPRRDQTLQDRQFGVTSGGGMVGTSFGGTGGGNVGGGFNINPASVTQIVPTPRPKPKQQLPWGSVDVTDPYRGAPPPQVAPTNWPSAYGNPGGPYPSQPLGPGEDSWNNGLGWGGTQNWDNVNSPAYGSGNPIGGYGSVGNPSGGYGGLGMNGYAAGGMVGDPRAGWIGQNGIRPSQMPPPWAIRIPPPFASGQGGMGSQTPTGQGTNPGGNPREPGGWGGPFAAGGMVGQPQGLRAAIQQNMGWMGRGQGNGQPPMRPPMRPPVGQPMGHPMEQPTPRPMAPWNGGRV